MASKFLKEFREFAVKGNVVDMAVGIIIGGAFTLIVQSLVKNVMNPILGLLIGGVDFANFFVVLKEGGTAGPYASLSAAQEAGAVTLDYGLFLNAVISFVIVAFAVFLLVRSINRMKREEAVAPKAPTDKACPHCFMTIPVKATKCGHCTADLPVSDLEPQGTP
ncbi:large-conductance mechanosensitive channel protein MscL [Salinicola corii]|uniref:Large-conductance mechanosensitive channel n=1 Tax=Salinicola corii TaxID=2606937 RepID=A0A640WGE7_9GAMM|nr:large-conductance mechanosensitive channel protein MscL [Salinicola corii]KAA0019305.1 large-conductance mechanosensitive channel protein MscL [Salinicola corii]